MYIKKYISIIFIVATFLVAFHHHDDLRSHNDCPVCVIQSNFFSADTPPDVVYLSLVENFSEPILTSFVFYTYKIIYQTKARSPPKIS